ncbi:hypothetical protein NA78x_002263 [Anatilimnocola sp. NA78]|uniref:hypothetical protein n=1 Tax=Anatilimnocola sp. NA78 TaxID=3415683 RepID=UPI003CE4E9CE
MNDYLPWSPHATPLGKTAFWILVVLILGFGGTCLWWFPPIFWAASALACGALLGFLFGVPKVHQADLQAKDGGPAVDEPRYRQLVNTNVEEISDWLTKIIVGVGLVQLTQIPPNFQRLAEYLAADQYDPGFAGGLVAFFAVTGFLSGYLLTRLFLAEAFRKADQADEFNESARLLPAAPAATPGPDGAQFIPATPTAEGRFVAALISNSPREAVLSSWLALEEAAKRAIRRRRPDGILPKSTVSMIDSLLKLEAISAEQAMLFSRLQNLRNLAVHSTSRLGENEVKDFVTNALALQKHLDEA